MPRYSDRSSDRYTDRAPESVGLAPCSQRVEGREQRVEGREQRVEGRGTTAWFRAAAGATRPCPRNPLPNTVCGSDADSSKGSKPQTARANREGDPMSDEMESIKDIIERGFTPTGVRHPVVRRGERALISPQVRSAVWYRDQGFHALEGTHGHRHRLASPSPDGRCPHHRLLRPLQRARVDRVAAVSITDPARIRAIRNQEDQ